MHSERTKVNHIVSSKPLLMVLVRRIHKLEVVTLHRPRYKLPNSEVFPTRQLVALEHEWPQLLQWDPSSKDSSYFSPFTNAI